MLSCHIGESCPQYCSAMLHPIQDHQYCSILLTTVNDVDRTILFNLVIQQAQNFWLCIAGADCSKAGLLKPRLTWKANFPIAYL